MSVVYSVTDGRGRVGGGGRTLKALWYIGVPEVGD